MVQDSAIFTKANEYKVAYGLTAPFSVTLNDPNLVSKVTPLFDTEYLTNGYRYGHSYYRRRIGNRTQAFEWH